VQHFSESFFGKTKEGAALTVAPAHLGVQAQHKGRAVAPQRRTVVRVVAGRSVVDAGGDAALRAQADGAPDDRRRGHVLRRPDQRSRDLKILGRVCGQRPDLVKSVNFSVKIIPNWPEFATIRDNSPRTLTKASPPLVTRRSSPLRRRHLSGPLAWASTSRSALFFSHTVILPLSPPLSSWPLGRNTAWWMSCSQISRLNRIKIELKLN